MSAHSYSWFLLFEHKKAQTHETVVEILINISVIYSAFRNNIFGLILLSCFQAKATVFLLFTLFQKSS